MIPAINKGFKTKYKQFVTTGVQDETQIEIKTGLSDGTQVVVKGQQFIDDNSKVNVVNK